MLRNHASKDHHRYKAAIVKAEEFKRSTSGQQPDVQQRLSKALADWITSNCQTLSSIMKTIVLCGRQNIALRGHRDSALDLERDMDGSENYGNFVALLNFRVEAGVTVLRGHFSTAARNATYTSNTIQNQIVRVLADQVSHCIIEKVKAAKWFTVIADEVTDVSNREQLSIVLPYVECDTGISGLDLTTKITSSLKELGLDLSIVCGQA